METGILQSGSVMHALERNQALIAHNLACSEVRGYRQQAIGFEGKPNGSIAFKDIKPISSLNPRLVAQVSSVPGAFEQTKVETDVAIHGEGFFKLQDGLGRSVFTRNGSFHFDAEGYLTDISGRKVQSDSGPIQAENKGQSITINKNGQIFEGTQQIGTLTAYLLPKELLNQSQRAFSANELKNVKASKMAHFEAGFLERSNVSPLHEMVNLIRVSHAHEANHNVLKQLDNELSEAIQVFGNPNL